jgi:hypothetical protein
MNLPQFRVIKAFKNHKPVADIKRNSGIIISWKKFFQTGWMIDGGFKNGF